MPFIAMDTYAQLTPSTKKSWIYEATKITTELLTIPPDKIQVLIREQGAENFGKAGATATDSDFAEKSRLVNWETQESYDDGSSAVNNMVVLGIDVFNVYTFEQKSEWANRLTAMTGDMLGTPADKVLILFRDMPPGNWGQTGVTGSHPEFLNVSRQTSVAMKTNA